MKSEKELKEIAKRDANRFCRRNSVYEEYDISVADMIKKLYINNIFKSSTSSHVRNQSENSRRDFGKRLKSLDYFF